MEYCRGEGRESFSRHVVPFSLLYNTEEGVSVCLIPKVASTTWLGYMAAFGEFPHGIVNGQIYLQSSYSSHREYKHVFTTWCQEPAAEFADQQTTDKF